jgi:hypothetical protein
VHVLAGGGLESGRRARGVPLRATGKEGHPRAGDVGLLHDIGQHVVPAVAVDDGQPLDAGPTKRLGNIGHHRDQRLGADAHRPGEPAVLVRARQRHGWQQQQLVVGAQPPGDDTHHDRVGDQRKEPASVSRSSTTGARFGQAVRSTGSRRSSAVARADQGVTYRTRYRDPAGREKARVFNRRWTPSAS